MNSTEKIEKANHYFNTGNFNGAILLYEEVLNGSEPEFVDRIRIKKKIAKAKNFLNIISSNETGEAFFPAVNTGLNIGAVFTIHISEEKKELFNNVINNGWKNVINLMTTFLDDEIIKSDNLLTVFDWKFNRFYPSIKKLLNLNESLEEDITGESFQLAMAVALVSQILNIKVDDKFAFSGTLQKQGNKIVIGEVESIDKKTEVLKRERKNVSRFIHSSVNNNLDDILKEVFGDEYLTDIIENYVKAKTDYIQLVEKISVRIYSQEHKENTALLLQFKHYNIPTIGLKKLNAFFERILNKIELNIIESGIILDGIFPNFATGMITPKFNNKIKKYIALKYAQESPPDNLKDKFNNGAVIVYRSQKSDFEIGEIIYY